MNKIFILITVLLLVVLISCNNNSKTDHSEHGKDSESKTEADSLMKDVMDGHNIGMGKMGKLTRAEQATRRLLDSISKLPSKARKAAEPVKVKLDSLQKELSYAEFAMNKWMEEFKMDSAISNAKERIGYLGSEKLKVGKVKEAILNSLQKADSLIKGKF